MHESPVAAVRLRYLVKVLFGLALLVLWVAAAVGLPGAGMAPPWRRVAVGVLVLGMLALPPLVGWLSGRVDELQRAIHQLACARSLPWLAAGCGAVGVLQADGLLPAFNQLWMLGALVAVWGVQLMLADRPHH